MRSSHPFSSSPFLFLFSLLFLAYLLASMADEAAVHIVYTVRPEGDEDPEAHHIKTLASLLGSEGAAKEALLYSYRTAASGFSARLTPKQVEEISRMPGVLQVVPSRSFKLHTGRGNRLG